MKNRMHEEWYLERRKEVEAGFAATKLQAGSEEVHTSPDGKYRLVVTDYDNDNYTRGMFYAGNRLIADVKRDYGIFHFGWATGHSNGHDYALCGQDLWGQTVIELDTRHRVDFVPEAARDASGFISAGYHPSPDRRLLVIVGCYWACPFQLVLCRFETPLSLPFPQVMPEAPVGSAIGWNTEGFVYESKGLIRMSDLMEYEQLPKDERQQLLQQRNEMGGTRVSRHLLRMDGSEVILDEKIVPNAK